MINASRLLNSVDKVFNFLTKDSEGRLVLFHNRPRFNKKRGYYHQNGTLVRYRAGLVPSWLNIAWDGDATIIERATEHEMPVKASELLSNISNLFNYLARDVVRSPGFSGAISLFVAEPMLHAYGFYYITGPNSWDTQIIPDWLIVDWDSNESLIKRG